MKFLYRAHEICKGPEVSINLYVFEGYSKTIVTEGKEQRQKLEVRSDHAGLEGCSKDFARLF